LSLPGGFILFSLKNVCLHFLKVSVYFVIEARIHVVQTVF
jgi:hypothetical protein